jgi:flagellar operon protein
MAQTNAIAAGNTISGASPLKALDRAPAADVASGAEFKAALGQVVAGQTAKIAGPPVSSSTEALKFSNHAIERMRSRGIAFQPEEMQKIESAVARAAAKGSKDSLILSGDNALIVSVKNKTVVTVVDRAAMKDNVFTNIDSTVVV